MSNQWFRLYTEFANDPKVQMLEEALQRRLVMLFCFRCNGDVTLHDEEVTFQLRISPEEWQRTKAIFIAKGFIDSGNNILNWDKRQYRSDSSAERVRRHREAKKQEDVTTCNVTVTPPEQIQNRTDTEQKVREDMREESRPALVVSKPKSKKLGSRLSSEWELESEWGEWAMAQGLSRSEVLREEEKFKDYWLSKTGANATKTDWDATWRNWIRRVVEGGNYGKVQR